MPEDAEILELGAGSGRITHPLIALGRRVVAVDFNHEMLDLIEGAEKIEARIQDLNLGRTFGGVLLMSNLINHPDLSERVALLRAIQRHLVHADFDVAMLQELDFDHTVVAPMHFLAGDRNVPLVPVFVSGDILAGSPAWHAAMLEIVAA